MKIRMSSVLLGAVILFLAASPCTSFGENGYVLRSTLVNGMKVARDIGTAARRYWILDWTCLKIVSDKSGRCVLGSSCSAPHGSSKRHDFPAVSETANCPSEFELRTTQLRGCPLRFS